MAKNDRSTFEKNISYSTSQLSSFIINGIKLEMASKLPLLSEVEVKYHNEIIVKSNKNILDKDEFDNFFNTLKKNYSNFIEMSYIPNELLSNLYSQVINIEEHKYLLKNRYFSYASFLMKMIEKTVSEDFIEHIETKFEALSSNCMQNYDGFWLNALFNSDCSNKSKTSINDIIKFNKEFTSLSILITIELFYNKLEQDIYELLINRLETKRVVIQIEQRSFFINNNIQPMIYCDDEEWNVDMNKVLNVFLNCINLMTDIQGISILAGKNCSFLLNDKNCELISSILKVNKDKIEVLSICRIELFSSKQSNILESVFKLNNLKFLLFKAVKFTEENLKKAMCYTKNITHPYCYIRFSKKCVIASD